MGEKSKNFKKFKKTMIMKEDIDKIQEFILSVMDAIRDQSRGDLILSAVLSTKEGVPVLKFGTNYADAISETYLGIKPDGKRKIVLGFSPEDWSILDEVKSNYSLSDGIRVLGSSVFVNGLNQAITAKNILTFVADCDARKTNHDSDIIDSILKRVAGTDALVRITLKHINTVGTIWCKVKTYYPKDRIIITSNAYDSKMIYFEHVSNVEVVEERIDKNIEGEP